MRNILPFVAVILALALLALACDGDDGPATTPSPAGGLTPTPQPSQTPGQEPSPITTLAETPTPRPTTPTPTAQPELTIIPAIAPADLTQYQGQTINLEECLFDPRTTLATCPGRGTYAPEPPIIGEDISCVIAIVEDQPVALQCRSEQPQQAVTYAIQ